MSEDFNFYKKHLSLKQIDHETEKKYLIQYKTNGCIKSRQLLIQHNLRFVVFIAKRFRNSSMDFMDIISTGNIGLMKAIDKYDLKYLDEVRIATYAERWIRAEISEYMYGKSVVKIPTTKNIMKLVSQIKSHNVMDLYDNTISTKTLFKLAKDLNVNKNDAIALTQAMYPMAGEIYDHEFSYEVDTDSESAYKYAVNIVKDYMTTNFPDNWTDIIMSRYFSSDITLKTLGEKYNCTSQRIDQIEKNALRQLKNELTNLKEVLQ